ncbi:hypothetical protein IWQ60_006856 [Tieghemiomyces parasiticus]|uniref:Transcription initiation factor TFIID subunit 1 histone acetyltransferase domain-containing protein n=1 Tax=Tieghemiomyces parasiticus TaxID=78921 RepID=A0A9W8A2B7_9FUNG|nr:hypothetical protein IWQ60_006856 [Tieghemiomyces parasiticus]
MSFANFLFGNIDEEGELEDFDLGDDVRATLCQATDGPRRPGRPNGRAIPGGGMLGAFLSAADLGVADDLASESGTLDTRPAPLASSALSTPRLRSPLAPNYQDFDGDLVKPMDDAVDFADFDELADDDDGAGLMSSPLPAPTDGLRSQPSELTAALTAPGSDFDVEPGSTNLLSDGLDTDDLASEAEPTEPRSDIDDTDIPGGFMGLGFGLGMGMGDLPFAAPPASLLARTPPRPPPPSTVPPMSATPARVADYNDDTLENLFGSPSLEAADSGSAPPVSPTVRGMDVDEGLVTASEPPPPTSSQLTLPASGPGAVAPAQPSQPPTAITTLPLYTAPSTAPADIRTLYPSFEPDRILNFTELFRPRVERVNLLKKRKPMSPPEPVVRFEPDTRAMFEHTILSSRLPDSPPTFLRRPAPRPPSSQSDGEFSLLEIGSSEDEGEGGGAPVPWATVCETLAAARFPVNTDVWDRRIQWDGDDTKPFAEPDGLTSASELTSSAADPVSPQPLVYHNEALADGSWLGSVIWDADRAFRPFDQLALDLNDTHMLFEPVLVSAHERAAKRRALRGNQDQLQLAVADEAEHRKQLQRIDKFNLSNDFFYAALQEGKVQRVRQTFGQLDLQHAVPAQLLQPPLYKTRLPKSELRAWHRPALRFPVGEDLTFAKLKAGKKKYRRKQGGEALKTTKDLTLKDTTPFILLEYAEEHPPIVPNVGMGSLLLNYYRRRDPADQHAPTAEVGEPFILDPADASPFFNFGNVEPGQTVQTLYNNLVRAPLFRHRPRPSDFLLVRAVYKGHARYYLRELPYLFAVGQTYPMQEVPGPHSRKVTNTIKNRLQVIAFRLLHRNPYHRLHMSTVAKYFPEYPDTHIRMRLKEFMEFQRKGSNSGFWKLKPSVPLPAEEDIRKILTPEMMCLYESMLVGECHLRDAGYAGGGDGPAGAADDGDETEESKLSTEEQLAPWITTRNFINAIQGKAMLKLYGQGDPTGRGEGFSFIRVSMKDIFLRAGETAEEKLAEIEARPKSAHRYNVAEQQQIYREEIIRIWNAQFRSLSNPQEPELTDNDDDDNDPRETVPTPGRPVTSHSLVSTGPSRATSPTPSMDRSSVMDLDDEPGNVPSRVGYVAPHQRKMLVIRRYARSATTGELTWQTEVLRDVAVINAYLRQRALIESDTAVAASRGTEPALVSLDETQRPAALKRRTQNQLQALRTRRDKKLARERAREAQHMTTLSLPQQSKPKKETILGHMKTNRKCPKFDEMMAGTLFNK